MSATPMSTTSPISHMEGFRLRLPVAGPLVGWCRPTDTRPKESSGERALPGLTARIFAQPDDSGTDEPLCLLIGYQWGPGQSWAFHYLEPIVTQALLDKSRTRLLSFFADDISVPQAHFDERGRVRLHVYSVHLPACNGTAPLTGLTGGLLLDAPSYAQTDTPHLKFDPTRALGAPERNSPAASSTEQGAEKKGSPAVQQLRELLAQRPELFTAQVAALEGSLDAARSALYAPAPATRSFEQRQARSALDARALLVHRWAEPVGSNGTLTLFATTCRYPGFGFERRRSEAGARAMMDKIVQANKNGGQGAPDALLMLGDQIYADATNGMFDPTSPIEKYASRYQALFASRRFRRLSAGLPVYMIADDHEFTNNWCQENMFQGTAGDGMYRTAIGLAHAYELSHSPYGARAVLPPFDYQMEIRGVPVYMMDTITMRRVPPGDIVHDDQLAALEKWLSKIPPESPKLICTGAVVAPGYARGLRAGSHDPLLCANFANWQGYARQRAALLDLVRKYGGGNVLLVSGDYHCAAQATIRHGGEIIARAVVVPPLYAPMRYINDSVNELAPLEHFAGYEIECLEEERWTGSGYAEISIHFGAQGEAPGAGAPGWRIETRFHCEPIADP